MNLVLSIKNIQNFCYHYSYNFLLSIIVLILKANIQRREKLELELSNRIEFDKVLLDTIPNPIYYKNTEGKFLGCNTAFANLVSSSK